MKPRPFILNETNYKEVKSAKYKLAILPWGATEAHNFHMPYGTDTILADNVAANAAEMAWKKGTKCIVLPAVPFGVNTGQLDVELCINMNPSTQLAVLRDIVEVLDHHDIPKLVILNAHGGNDFKPIIRELSLDFPDVFICSINWWTTKPAEKYFIEPGGHAGELETSAVMHIAPDWVLPLDQAGDGSVKTFKVEGLKKGWAIAQRQWTEATKDTGDGNPQYSTSKKGETFLKVTTEAIGDFLHELGNTNNDDMYE